jgi:hypothetical protein
MEKPLSLPPKKETVLQDAACDTLTAASCRGVAQARPRSRKTLPYTFISLLVVVVVVALVLLLLLVVVVVVVIYR